MIRILIGDMLKSKAQTLVNTVNCVGVMGAGIALEFKKKYPEYFEDYKGRCEEGKVRLGFPYLYKRLEPPWIISFPTKDHWRSMARLSDILSGLEWLLGHYKEWRIESLAVPPLGTGHGQLEWRIIGPTLYRYLSRMEIPVELYAPHGTPREQVERDFLLSFKEEDPNRPLGGDFRWVKPAWVAMVEALKRIEEQPYRKPIGRTILQKIAYLATEEGLPTGLTFEKGSFGPFAAELKSLTTRLLNNGMIEEHRTGPMYRVTVGPTYEDARRAYATYLVECSALIDKIVDLFMRTKMDTNMAEVVTSIIFVARRLREVQGGRLTEEDVYSAVNRWKARRRPPIDSAQLAYMVRFLAGLSWIKVAPSPDLKVPELDFAGL